MSTGANKGYAAIPEYEPDESEHRRKMARAINRLNQGKFNCTVSLTLRASQTTTTLSDPRIAGTSFIFLMPTTANAATALASVYITGLTAGSNNKAGSATINHASSANSDQTFVVGIFG